jgi:hypothetical protein
MTLGWRKWKRLPAANQTWANWKVHWTAAFTEMHDLNWMTTGKSLFGANQAATELKQAQQMATSLDNLANASIQKNTTIESLVTTNAALTKAVQEIQKTLLHMSTSPPTAGTPAPTTTPESKCTRPAHWSPIKPAWDKEGYCWSHGFKVKVGHNSLTCTSRKAGHQAGATRTNTLGGSTFNTGYLHPTT